jgi:hypothetical protein
VGKSTQELKYDIERTREDLGETLDAIGDRVSPGRIVHRRTERVRNAFTSARTTIMGSTESVQDGAHQAGAAMTSAADQARQAPQQVLRQTEGNPLAAGLIAFGVGLVVASVIPPSQSEQRAAAAIQDKIEPVKDQAIEAAQRVKDEVQNAAQSAAEQVKETASHAASEVRDQAQSSAEHVKDEAKAAAEDTKDLATEGAQHVKPDGQA